MQNASALKYISIPHPKMDYLWFELSHPASLSEALCHSVRQLLAAGQSGWAVCHPRVTSYYLPQDTFLFSPHL